MIEGGSDVRQGPPWWAWGGSFFSHGLLAVLITIFPFSCAGTLREKATEAVNRVHTIRLARGSFDPARPWQEDHPGVIRAGKADPTPALPTVTAPDPKPALAEPEAEKEAGRQKPPETKKTEPAVPPRPAEERKEPSPKSEPSPVVAPTVAPPAPQPAVSRFRQTGNSESNDDQGMPPMQIAFTEWHEIDQAVRSLGLLLVVLEPDNSARPLEIRGGEGPFLPSDVRVDVARYSRLAQEIRGVESERILAQLRARYPGLPPGCRVAILVSEGVNARWLDRRREAVRQSGKDPARVRLVGRLVRTGGDCELVIEVADAGGGR